MEDPVDGRDKRKTLRELFLKKISDLKVHPLFIPIIQCIDFTVRTARWRALVCVIDDGNGGVLVARVRSDGSHPHVPRWVAFTKHPNRWEYFLPPSYCPLQLSLPLSLGRHYLRFLNQSRFTVWLRTCPPRTSPRPTPKRKKAMTKSLPMRKNCIAPLCYDLVQLHSFLFLSFDSFCPMDLFNLSLYQFYVLFTLLSIIQLIRKLFRSIASLRDLWNSTVSSSLGSFCRGLAKYTRARRCRWPSVAVRFISTYLSISPSLQLSYDRFNYIFC